MLFACVADARVATAKTAEERGAEFLQQTDAPRLGENAAVLEAHGITKTVKQEISREIEDLSLVAKDDEYLIQVISPESDGIKGRNELKKIDMQARRNYFNDEGWAEYQQYVSLAKGLVSKGSTWKFSHGFNYQNFTLEEDESVRLRVDGVTSEHLLGSGTRERHFKLEVRFKVDPQDAKMTIRSWRFLLLSN